MDDAGLFLLFAAGKRPTRAALKDFAKAQRAVSVSHDPLEAGPLHLVTSEDTERSSEATHLDETQLAEHVWVELLREGLTFDLLGLAPGPKLDFPEIEYCFDLEARPTASKFDVLHLKPGQHLSGGKRTLPVVKGLIGLARDITNHFDDLEAVAWPASQSAIGRRFFESVASAWLEGGPFPALGLTAFRETMDGALQSVGLSFFIGQELRIEPPLSANKTDATRLGVRLINHLVLAGRLEADDRLVAPDGRALSLRPSANGKFIRVWQD